MEIMGENEPLPCFFTMFCTSSKLNKFGSLILQMFKQPHMIYMMQSVSDPFPHHPTEFCHNLCCESGILLHLRGKPRKFFLHAETGRILPEIHQIDLISYLSDFIRLTYQISVISCDLYHPYIFAYQSLQIGTERSWNPTVLGARSG